MSVPPGGRMTVQNSHADLGAFRHDTLLFFEKALVHMGNLVNGLVRIGFPLANMVVMALSVNFGSGCMASSQVCLEPDRRRRDGFGPFVPGVPIGRLPHYHTMTNTFVTHIENDFSLLVNMLRASGTLSRQAVVCLSMDLKLSSSRHINISLVFESETGHELEPSEDENDNDHHDDNDGSNSDPGDGGLGGNAGGAADAVIRAEPYRTGPGNHNTRLSAMGPVVWQPVRRGDVHEFWMNSGFRLRPRSSR